jgi:hypothetical protein
MMQIVGAFREGAIAAFKSRTIRWVALGSALCGALGAWSVR